MKIIRELWNDEAGLILSAEAVMIGTVGVLGAIAGLSTVATAVNGELKEMASSIRSLDQSYGYVGHRSCGAWTAGSCYIQQDVQKSLAELNGDGADIHGIQQQVEAERKAHSQPVQTSQPGSNSQPRIEPTPAPDPIPNQIPVQEPAKPVETGKST